MATKGKSKLTTTHSQQFKWEPTKANLLKTDYCLYLRKTKAVTGNPCIQPVLRKCKIVNGRFTDIYSKAGLAKMLGIFEKINFKHPCPKKQRAINKMLNLASQRGYRVPREYTLSDYRRGYIDGAMNALSYGPKEKQELLKKIMEGLSNGQSK